MKRVLQQELKEKIYNIIIFIEITLALNYNS